MIVSAKKRLEQNDLISIKYIYSICSLPTCFARSGINSSIFQFLYVFSPQLILQQQVTAQLPQTFYSGPFAKQSANAVSTELVQQQQLLLLPQQPPQLQLVNKSEQPWTESKNIIGPFI